MTSIDASTYQIHVNNHWSTFTNFVAERKYSSVVILVDENTKLHCYEKIKEYLDFNHLLIEIQAGEIYKTLNTCENVWKQMLKFNCDRKSLMINLGGGVIGDLGGFCASTYMRGIDFIQIPTTLLSQVDASVGGKLGVDLNNLKNIVGVFNNPQMVWVDTSFLSSLPANELRSGYAEVIKHCLIANKDMWSTLKAYSNPNDVNNWSEIVEDSIRIKNNVVTEDPREQGKRKILNYGHTIGHAIESLLLETENKLLHGEAIAQGMILEAKLSLEKGLLSQGDFNEVKNYIETVFGTLDVSIIDVEKLISYATMDKKNFAGEIKMASIDQIGSCSYDITISSDEIKSLFV